MDNFEQLKFLNKQKAAPITNFSMMVYNAARTHNN